MIVKGGINMTIRKPSFWDYLVFDVGGNIIGLKPDTPPKIVADYEKFKAEEEELMKRGIKT